MHLPYYHNLPQRFGWNLRCMRKDAGLTIAELAAASGCSASAISQYQMGRRSPSFDAIQRLADALECDPSTFFRI